jgi:hypothetical protein
MYAFDEKVSYTYFVQAIQDYLDIFSEREKVFEAFNSDSIFKAYAKINSDVLAVDTDHEDHMMTIRGIVWKHVEAPMDYDIANYVTPHIIYKLTH